VRNIPAEAAATSFITGDPDAVLEKVESFLDAGLDGLLISLPDAYDLEPIELAGRTLAGRLGSATAV
jgi:alkanesulfonate monooxygenase SsuD/methylene tetrahydromethanopterin reductase-like flavin-dependent oxidoreductase (luciferase family)